LLIADDFGKNLSIRVAVGFQLVFLVGKRF
jgi:hypothetical protein